MKGFERNVSKVDLLIDSILLFWGNLILVGVSFIIILQIISRFLFQSSFSWTEEISQWSVIVAVFSSFPLLEKRDNYIKLDLVLKRLPERVSLVIDIVAKILLISISVILIYSQRLLYPSLRMSETQASGISLLWFHGPIAIGLLLWIVSIFSSLRNYIKYLQKRSITQDMQTKGETI